MQNKILSIHWSLTFIDEKYAFNLKMTAVRKNMLTSFKKYDIYTQIVKNEKERNVNVKTNQPCLKGRA